MAKYKKLTKEDKIVNGYLMGATVDQLSEIAGVQKTTVYYYLRKNKISKKITLEGKLRELLLKEVSQYSIRYLSKKYKINRNKLCRLINSESELTQTQKTLIGLRKKLGLSAYQIAQAMSLETKRVREELREQNLKEQNKIK